MLKPTSAHLSRHGNCNHRVHRRGLRPAFFAVRGAHAAPRPRASRGVVVATRRAPTLVDPEAIPHRSGASAWLRREPSVRRGIIEPRHVRASLSSRWSAQCLRVAEHLGPTRAAPGDPVGGFLCPDLRRLSRLRARLVLSEPRANRYVGQRRTRPRLLAFTIWRYEPTSSPRHAAILITAARETWETLNGHRIPCAVKKAAGSGTGCARPIRAAGARSAFGAAVPGHALIPAWARQRYCRGESLFTDIALAAVFGGCACCWGGARSPSSSSRSR